MQLKKCAKYGIKIPVQSKLCILAKLRCIKIAGTAYNKLLYISKLNSENLPVQNISVPVGNVFSNSVHISIQTSLFRKLEKQNNGSMVKPDYSFKNGKGGVLIYTKLPYFYWF